MKNTFGIPIIPKNDAERLKALYRYEILDTPPEGAFNRIASLAAKLFQVPIALISLVDNERVFFKANVGMPGVTNVPRGESLCSLAILQEKPTVFKDAENEPCLLANPLVAGSFGLKFYAGAPLITSDGYNIGTVCLVDKKSRDFSEKEMEMLEDLAAVVMDEIEIRISSVKALRSQQDLMHIAIHDLKNPTLSIKALSELLQNGESEEMKVKLTGMITSTADKMTILINRLVKLAQIETREFSLNLKQENVCELVKEVVSENEPLALKKEQEIVFNYEPDCRANIDKLWMKEVFDNLINNAIKYSPKGKTIEVTLKNTDSELLFEVKDEGQGFGEEDMAKIFQKFSKLSSIPTGSETSTGLGLSIVKTLVELHNGNITVESKGKNMGSRMLVKIPDLP